MYILNFGLLCIILVLSIIIYLIANDIKIPMLSELLFINQSKNKTTEECKCLWDPCTLAERFKFATEENITDDQAYFWITILNSAHNKYHDINDIIQSGKETDKYIQKVTLDMNKLSNCKSQLSTVKTPKERRNANGTCKSFGNAQNCMSNDSDLSLDLPSTSASTSDSDLPSTSASDSDSDLLSSVPLPLIHMNCIMMK